MKSFRELKAGDVMTTPVASLAADTPLRDAAGMLTGNSISGALVVDPNGVPMGVVSMFDIVSHLAGLERPAGEPGGFYRFSYPKLEAEEGGERWEREVGEGEEPEEMPVGELMTPEIIAVDHETPVVEVARLMVERGIHRVFVKSKGKPIGVITTMDLLARLDGVRTHARA